MDPDPYKTNMDLNTLGRILRYEWNHAYIEYRYLPQVVGIGPIRIILQYSEPESEPEPEPVEPKLFETWNRS